MRSIRDMSIVELHRELRYLRENLLEASDHPEDWGYTRPDDGWVEFMVNEIKQAEEELRRRTP